MAPGQLNARHWIGGEWIDSKERLDSINPATGETIGTYANGGEAEATKAIAVAKRIPEYQLARQPPPACQGD